MRKFAMLLPALAAGLALTGCGDVVIKEKPGVIEEKKVIEKPTVEKEKVIIEKK